MSHDPRAIANKFIKLAAAHREKTLSNTFFVNALELQKLVIVAHGFHFLLHKNCLVSDKLSVGEFEPTFKRLAESLGAYGDGPVTAEISNGTAYEVFLQTGAPLHAKLSNNEKSTIKAVWGLFISYKPRCEILSILTRGSEVEWKEELKYLTGKYADEYPVEALAKRIANRLGNGLDIAA